MQTHHSKKKKTTLKKKNLWEKTFIEKIREKKKPMSKQFKSCFFFQE